LDYHSLSHRHGSGYLSGSDARGYLSGSELRGYASGSDIPPTPGSGSITLPGSLEGQRQSFCFNFILFIYYFLFSI
jgi:hypothetical protein